MPEIKIATFNIHHGIDMDARLVLDDLASLLRQIDADILCLQEVDVNRAASNKVNEPRFLAEKLAMHFVYGAVRSYQKGSYGNAILSKYPLSLKKNHKLPDSTDDRYCLQADVESDIKLSIFNTHLGLKQQVRYQQIKDILVPLVQGTEHPAVLAGDFNAPPNRLETIFLASTLTDTFAKNSGTLISTYPASNPVARIDYIFINSYCSLADYFIVDAAVSDHLPVVSRLIL